MHRRTVLRGAATVAAIGIAGCAAGGTPGNGTDSPTDEPPIELVDNEFEVVGIDHAGEPTAGVTFHNDENRVTFRGTIEGSDGCKTAAIDAIEYDSEGQEIHLSVRTENREGTEGQACTQALVFVDYEARATFSGGTPKRASISHDGREIASGAHESSSAGGMD